MNFEETTQCFRIPENATLKDVIEILNKMSLVVNLNDEDNKEWIYNHKEWFIET